jgi:hypothetical protein
MRIIMRTREDAILKPTTGWIISRLLREGWIHVGGGSDDKFSNAARPGALIIVPRHWEVSAGVARDIAKKAG